MDTSETYIKMCDCPEIQDGHEPQAGDCYYAHGKVIILPMSRHIPNFCDYYCLYLVGADDYWWLPRQEDLQKMLEGDWSGEILRRFHIWCKDCGFSTRVNKSISQLWLAFVMKEKHSKHWTGDEWVLN